MILRIKCHLENPTDIGLVITEGAPGTLVAGRPAPVTAWPTGPALTTGTRLARTAIPPVSGAETTRWTPVTARRTTLPTPPFTVFRWGSFARSACFGPFRTEIEILESREIDLVELRPLFGVVRVLSHVWKPRRIPLGIRNTLLWVRFDCVGKGRLSGSQVFDP